MRLRLSLLLLVLATVTAARGVRADAADEAEQLFRAGAERYQAGDFRGALLHFLGSHRLSPNHNVLFNVARCYDQLGEFPNAWRYYTLALEGTPEGAQRERIEEALRKVAPRVAVLEVVSDPPGATVYLDRKELGARGATPTRLGLPAGKVRVFLELPGFEVPEPVEVVVEQGRTATTRVELRPVLGRLVVTTDATSRGAAVRLGDGSGRVLGTLPLDVPIAPGRHRLLVEKEGFQRLELFADVTARSTVRLPARLTPLTGSLVVTTDLPSALIEVDGRPVGFSPAVVTLPRGRHQVRVQLRGFREWISEVDVAPRRTTRLEVEIARREQVTAAARAEQTVAEAPASVSVLSRDELRWMAYPTIAEALRGTRGLYLSDDRSYTTIGFRGFSRPGDYGNKTLILLDGHPTNDNILGQAFPGYEGRVDLDDVERIEVVRGPGSALYGTGAFFGVVNLVRRGFDDPSGGEVSLGTVEGTGGRGRVHGRLRLSSDASVWTSVSYASSRGRELRFPEYLGDPRGPDGVARDVDGFEAMTVEGRSRLGPLEVSAFWHRRDKRLPTGEYEVLFNDPRTRFFDERAFVEARFEPRLSRDVDLLLRVHGNLYDFRTTLPYDEPPAGDGVARERYVGRWAGVEQRVVLRASEDFRVTLGGEAQRHFEASMGGEDSVGVYLARERNPYTTLAGYAVIEAGLARWLDVSAGARVDHFRWEFSEGTRSRTAGSPRAALVARPYEAGITKLMGGTAFRAPSVYELFYEASVQRRSPGLSPERVVSGELEHLHRFAGGVTALASVYGNWVSGLVVSAGGGTPADPLFFTNSDAPILALGAETELRRELRGGWLGALSAGVQRSRYVGSSSGGFREVPNSPSLQASARGLAPLLGDALRAGSRVTLETGRADRHDLTDDPAQRVTPPSVVWDLMLSGQLLSDAVEWHLGVWDVLDARQQAPTSREFRMTTVPTAGRTFHAMTRLRF